MNRFHSQIAAAVFAAAIALFAGTDEAHAQETGAVSGTVMNSTAGRPLAGAQVSMPDIQVGVLTNQDGQFTIREVPVGEHTIVVQTIGFTRTQQTVTVEAGQTTNVTLRVEESAVEVEGLVVTALGISRQERQLGYSVQDLQSEELVEATEPNITSAFAGEIAGLDTKNIGPAGGSVKITLRGANSISGENQPLIVVDGIPMDNSARTYQRSNAGRDVGQLQSETDYGNALSDLDPNDIKSVSVLKGATAAALYGSRASNGAIVITTKQGEAAAGGGVDVTLSTNLTSQTPLKMPNWQNSYGQGGGGKFRFLDGYGAGVNDGTDESWGPAFEGQMIPQWPDGEPRPWIPRPYNVRDFYETGFTAENHLGVSAAVDNAHARFSATDLRQEGVVPGHNVGRTSLSISGGVDLGDDWTVGGRGNYIVRDAGSMPQIAYEGFNPNQGFIWMGRQVEIRDMRDIFDENGRQRSWNYNYHDNPYWELFVRENTQNRERLLGHLRTNYHPSEWLNVTFRAGTDFYDEKRRHNVPKTKIAREEGEGEFRHTDVFRQETNFDLIGTITEDIVSDLSLEFRAGGNLRMETDEFNDVQVERLNVDSIYNTSNAAQPPTITQELARRETRSIFGAATFSWKNWFTVEVTGRNDWSSTLPEENNSYFYPSASVGFVFTDALGESFLNDFLSYGKLRASWSRVGADADPYQLRSVLDAQQPPFGDTPGYFVSSRIPNQNLKPEETESWEAGMDLRTQDNRASLDLTYYHSVTRDQILAVQVPASSGYTSQVLNAGKIRNKGFEAVLNVSPLDSDDGLNWDVTANFAANDNRVVRLHESLESIVLGQFWRLSVEAQEGQPYGALVGFANRRNENGELLIGQDGYPMRSENVQVLGSYQPDWTGGIRNTLRYGGVDFSFLFDVRQGGELFSVTNQWGKYSGVLQETVEGRETGFVYDGVHPDGSRNTTAVPSQTRFKAQWSTQSNNVFDASYVKLREVKFTFDLPENFLRALPIESGNVGLVGRNLILWDNIPHVDPETGFDTGNVQGVEYGQIPSTRSLGMFIRVSP